MLCDFALSVWIIFDSGFTGLDDTKWWEQESPNRKVNEIPNETTTIGAFATSHINLLGRSFASVPWQHPWSAALLFWVVIYTLIYQQLNIDDR